MKTMEEWILNYNNPKGPFRNLSDLLHAIRDEALDAAATLADTRSKDILHRRLAGGDPCPALRRRIANAIRKLKEQP